MCEAAATLPHREKYLRINHRLARRLVEAVYRRAREAGSSRVYWQTHETNATAMKLYDTVAEKSGFVVYRKFL